MEEAGRGLGRGGGLDAGSRTNAIKRPETRNPKQMFRPKWPQSSPCPSQLPEQLQSCRFLARGPSLVLPAPRTLASDCVTQMFPDPTYWLLILRQLADKPPSYFSSQESPKDQHINFGGNKIIEKQAQAIIKGESHDTSGWYDGSCPSERHSECIWLLITWDKDSLTVCALPGSSLHTFLWILMRSFPAAINVSSFCLCNALKAAMFTQGGTHAWELSGRQGHCLHGKLLRLGKVLLHHGDVYTMWAPQSTHPFCSSKLNTDGQGFNLIFKVNCSQEIWN